MLDIRTPKGTVDYGPDESACIEKILSISKSVFKKHGAVSIDTPTFELRDILLNKFGDDEVNIYNLEDQGGDICSLRYDLTVGFARYLAQNKIKRIKRYQAGKVFRRDQPAITKGRYREFYQCDFDIAGDYLPMVPDSEIIKSATEILDNLNLGDYILKINNRKILSAFAQILEVDQHRINSTIDKLDKIGWENVENELIGKGIERNKIETLKKFISIKGIEIFDNPILEEIKKTEAGKEGIEELQLLQKYLKIFNIKNYIFDFSLARGANYYTGMIFEGFYKNYDCGAVLAGGRYDNLIDSLLNNKNMKVPCVGFSVGVMRLFSLMMANISDIEYIKVFISSAKELFLEERLSILNELWENNINSETFYTKRINIGEHKKYCKNKKIPILIVIGEAEIENNEVMINFNNQGTLIKRNQMVGYIKSLLEK